MSNADRMAIRAAEISDLAGMLDIINREIREGIAHFGVVEQTLEEIAAEHAARGPRPWLVAVLDGVVAGFARAGRWKPRQAYDWTVEVSVYLRPEFHRKGIGRRLYATLFDELEQAGFRRVIAGMTMPNPASQALHEAMGMRFVGEFERQGFKHGRWANVRYYQLDLPRGGDPDAQPTPID